MKPFAYMEKRKSEQGFTFVSLLIALSILALILPLTGHLLQAASFPDQKEELTIRQFFLFLRNDMINARDYEIDSQEIKLVLDSDEIATIEKYGLHIRRQVDGKGHEIYLRDIRDVHFSKLPYGMRVSITSSEGEQYEKTIIFYE